MARSVFPDATDEELNGFLWSHTAFPFAGAKTVYAQLRRYKRLKRFNVPLCDGCGEIIRSDARGLCPDCERGIDQYTEEKAVQPSPGTDVNLLEHLKATVKRLADEKENLRLRNEILRSRTDLPPEQHAYHKRVTALQEQNQELKHCLDLIAHSECEKVRGSSRPCTHCFAIAALAVAPDV